jgi:PAS domain S-box-containing protein
MIGLNEYLEFFKLTFGNHNSMVLLVNSDAVIIKANRSAERFYDYLDYEMDGMSLHEICKLENSDFEAIFQNSLNSETAKHKCLHISKSKQNLDVIIHSSSIKIDNQNYLLAIIEDNRDRIKTDQYLEELEKSYALLFDTVSEAIYIQSPDGVFLDINKGAEKMYGFSKEEFIGKTPDFISVPGRNDDKLVGEALARVFKTGKPEKFEFWAYRKNGEIFIKEVISNKGKYFGKDVLITTARDISERKAREEQLKASEKMIKSISESVPDIIYIYGVNECRNIYFNRSFSGLLGYAPDELSDMDDEFFKKVIHPDDLKQFDEFYLNLQNWSSDYVFEFEYRIRTKQGDWRWFKGAEKEFLRINGRLEQVIGTVRDQTDVKLIEQELQESENRLKAAVAYAPFPMIIFDENFNVHHISDGWLSSLGYDKNEFLNLREWLYNIYPASRTEEIEEGLQKALEVKQKTHLGEKQILSKAGETKVLDFYLTPINGENDSLKLFLSIASDVSDRIKHKNELIKAKEKAEESDKLKTVFLANMSHEIRTPLNTILGYAKLFEISEITKDERIEYSKLINKKGGELLNIINDILDISKIEANQLPIRIEDCLPNSILAEVYSTFNFKEKSKPDYPVKFCVAQKCPNNLLVRADESRLMQVLCNLVENAFKYTEKGKIEIGAYPDKSQIIFYVKDSGPGIPNDKLDIIFERFRQGEDDNLNRKFSGSGLGLSICKGLLSLMDGSIWVETELGVGSTFYFSLAISTATNLDFDDFLDF